MPHFYLISEISYSLLLTLVQQNESFDSKIFHGKHFKLLSGRLTVESYDVFDLRFDVFCYSYFKMEIEDKIPNSLFDSAKQNPLNKQELFAPYYSLFLCFLEDFLATTTAAKGVRFHRYIIK